ncbi:MAG: glucosaminidase domain-containing protein [Lachnospiraceae bacterium]|nr:glucosaminidase domain-containing protein [Lachnospiraceae bacterium]
MRHLKLIPMIILALLLSAIPVGNDNVKKADAASLKIEGLQTSSEYVNTNTSVNFSKMSAKTIVNRVGETFTMEQVRTGIPASVMMAQFILESGYGKSKLAKKAKNYFGMKTQLSGNTWKNSYWNGKSSYTIVTREVYKGKTVRMKAKFRKYSSFRQSVMDHSSYLAYSKNGKKLRYKGLVGCKSYKKAARIIGDGGYATGRSYERALISIIKKWNLTRFDV